MVSYVDSRDETSHNIHSITYKDCWQSHDGADISHLKPVLLLLESVISLRSFLSLWKNVACSYALQILIFCLEECRHTISFTAKVVLSSTIIILSSSSFRIGNTKYGPIGKKKNMDLSTSRTFGITSKNK